MKVDNTLVGNIVRVVRGSKSQGYIIQKANFSSNVIANWEKGKTRIEWGEFVTLCELCRIPIKQRLKEYLHFQGDILDVPDLLSYLWEAKVKGP